MHARPHALACKLLVPVPQCNCPRHVLHLPAFLVLTITSAHVRLCTHVSAARTCPGLECALALAEGREGLPVPSVSFCVECNTLNARRQAAVRAREGSPVPSVSFCVECNTLNTRRQAAVRAREGSPVPSRFECNTLDALETRHVALKRPGTRADWRCLSLAVPGDPFSLVLSFLPPQKAEPARPTALTHHATARAPSRDARRARFSTYSSWSRRASSSG